MPQHVFAFHELLARHARGLVHGEGRGHSRAAAGKGVAVRHARERTHADQTEWVKGAHGGSWCHEQHVLLVAARLERRCDLGVLHADWPRVLCKLLVGRGGVDANFLL